jgi:hypothetical protein
MPAPADTLARAGDHCELSPQSMSAVAGDHCELPPRSVPAVAGDHCELSPQSMSAVARAFLALADDGDWPEQRTPARVATALAAALLLACAAPLGWMARPHAKAPATPAALSARLPGAADDD